MAQESRILSAYVRAVFRHWWFYVVEIVLVVVDVGERWFNIWIQPPHWLFLAVGVAVLTVAQYFAFSELYHTSRQRIDSLEVAVAAHNSRAAQLRIVPDGGSHYILIRAVVHQQTYFDGALLEFHLMVENTGLRKSNIDNYQVEIVELGKTFPGLQSQEQQKWIQGRQAQYDLQSNRVLSTTGIVRIEPESTTNHGLLRFKIPEINMVSFANAGLNLVDQGNYANLHCRLTLTDTTGSSAMAEFELQES